MERAARLDRKLGEMRGSVRLVLVREDDAMTERAAEAWPASGRVVEEVSQRVCEVSRGRSTDEVEAVGEELRLEGPKYDGR